MQDFERAKEKEGAIQREVRRGDIFWAPVIEGNEEGELYVGKNRPVIIVSNEKANLFSNWVTYVPITSQPKKVLPTHVDVSCNLIKGPALCEKVSTITKEKLDSFAQRGWEKSLAITHLDQLPSDTISLSKKCFDKIYRVDGETRENVLAEAGARREILCW